MQPTRRRTRGRRSVGLAVPLLLATAACANTAGDNRVGQTADRDEEVPTGSILPGGAAGSPVDTAPGSPTGTGPGSYNGGFQQGLR